VTAADAAAASTATATATATEARPAGAAGAMERGGEEREGGREVKRRGKQSEREEKKSRAFRCFPSTPVEAGASATAHRTDGVKRHSLSLRAQDDTEGRYQYHSLLYGASRSHEIFLLYIWPLGLEKQVLINHQAHRFS
jgi:hypothetical protein